MQVLRLGLPVVQSFYLVTSSRGISTVKNQRNALFICLVNSLRTTRLKLEYSFT